jgi:uncharacterized cupredoxin-like copper-binding protein
MNIKKVALGGAVAAIGVLALASVSLAVAGSGDGPISGGSPAHWIHRIIGGDDGGPGTANTVGVTLGEWRVTPDAASAPAGKIRFVEKNEGSMRHETVLVKTDLAPSALPMKQTKQGGKLDEGDKRLEFVQEVGHIDPGDNKSRTFDLKPGAYILMCNIAGHYGQGMYAGFMVE